MIIIFTLIFLLVFYIFIWGYLYIVTKKIKNSSALKIFLWILFSIGILILLLIEMAGIQKYFSEYNKAISVIPLLVAAGFSFIKNKEMWKQNQKP